MARCVFSRKATLPLEMPLRKRERLEKGHMRLCIRPAQPCGLKGDGKRSVFGSDHGSMTVDSGTSKGTRTRLKALLQWASSCGLAGGRGSRRLDVCCISLFRSGRGDAHMIAAIAR